MRPRSCRVWSLAFDGLGFSGTYIMASPWELNFQHWEPGSTHRKCLFTTMGICFHIVSGGCLFEASPKFRPPELGPPEVLIPWVACVGVSCRFGIRTSGGFNSRDFVCARHFLLSAFDKSLQHEHGYTVCACIDALNDLV